MIYSIKLYGIAHLFDFGHLMNLRKECADCIPMPDPVINSLLERTLNYMNPQVVANSYDTFNKDFAEKCHEKGVIVIIDEDNSYPEEWQKAIDLGVKGIQTDDPEKLIQFLNRMTQ